MSIVYLRCEWILGQNGDVKRFDIADRELLVRNVIEPMASDGLRTICLAYKNFLTGRRNDYNLFEASLKRVSCHITVACWIKKLSMELNNSQTNAS